MVAAAWDIDVKVDAGTRIELEFFLAGEISSASEYKGRDSLVAADLTPGCLS